MKQGFFVKVGALLVISILANGSLAFGDGCFFSEREKHLNEPDQKAVILWDGQKESMVISSKVNSPDIANLSNVVWLIPLESSQKPEVNPSDISLFKTFVDYFTPQNYGGRNGLFKGIIRSGSVDLLETKKIDVYDIAILRATDPKELIDWLNSNGYVFPESTAPLFKRYIDNKWYYFVINRINLSNKFGPDFVKVQDLLGKLKSKENGFNSFVRTLPTGMISEMEQWLRENNFNLILDRLRRSVIISVLKGIPFENSVANTEIGKALDFISKEEYELLLKTCTLKDGVYEKLSLWGDYKWSDFLIGDDEADILRPSKKMRLLNRYAPDSVITVNLQNALIGFGKRFDIGLGSIEKELKLQSISVEDYGKFLNENLYKIQEKYRTVYEALNLKNMRSFFSVREEITQLSSGVATPLEIDFYPQDPLYPLEISGINSGGYTQIEIYFCAPYVVEDSAGLLKIDDVKIISPQIKESTKQHLNLDKAEYVTRLIYKGDLSGLKGDALFKERSFQNTKSVSELPK